MAARQWTQAQRDKQSKLIHGWKPWEKSTGAKTPEGKAISAKNAYRYELRETYRDFMREMRGVRKEMCAVLALSAELEKNGVMQIFREMAKEQATSKRG